jgi:hypothetical protein
MQHYDTFTIATSIFIMFALVYSCVTLIRVNAQRRRIDRMLRHLSNRQPDQPDREE